MEEKKIGCMSDNAKIARCPVTHNIPLLPPWSTFPSNIQPFLLFWLFTMALRISTQRAVAVLKASKRSSPCNAILKRNASQATATATNLSEGLRNDIHVGFILTSSTLDIRLTLASVERSATPQCRSALRLRDRKTGQRTGSLHGQDLRAPTTNVRQGWRMLPLGCREPKILGFYRGNCSQCLGTLWSWDEQNNCSTGAKIARYPYNIQFTNIQYG